MWRRTQQQRLPVKTDRFVEIIWVPLLLKFSTKQVAKIVESCATSRICVCETLEHFSDMLDLIVKVLLAV
jgi:hypothetical protein